MGVEVNGKDGEDGDEREITWLRDFAMAVRGNRKRHSTKTLQRTKLATSFPFNHALKNGSLSKEKKKNDCTT